MNGFNYRCSLSSSHLIHFNLVFLSDSQKFFFGCRLTGDV